MTGVKFLAKSDEGDANLTAILTFSHTAMTPSVFDMNMKVDTELNRNQARNHLLVAQIKSK